MTKFSVARDDAGEGPSNPRQMRQMITGENHEYEQEKIEDQSGTEHIDGEESESEQEGDFIKDDDDYSLSTRLRSKNCGRGDILSMMNGRNQSISVFLTDPGVLDCFICYEALSIPVFQCENGHISCSSCCVKLGNKCPSCFKPIGYNRCQAIEKVLESVQISCANAPYGCEEIMPYSKKYDHEKECIYAPCCCPHSGCNFVASYKELALHCSGKHGGLTICFVYDLVFSVLLSGSGKVIVLQELSDGNLFILKNNVEQQTNVVSVSCIAPNSSKEVFHCKIWARSQGCCLKLQSFIQNSQGHIAITPSTGFLSIPSTFFSSDGLLKLDICITRNLSGY